MRLRDPSGRPGMDEQRAIIDIGSNTVRLVIYGGPPRVPVVLYNEKITARLGKNVAENGMLSGKAKSAALAALGRYAALLRIKGVRKVETVATAAVRDAGDGEDFLRAVAALGLQPRLLSGEEEALTGAQGVMAAFPGAHGMVGDLGGGSLELTGIDGNRCEHGTSLPLGTLHLSQMRAAGPATFARRVHKVLSEADWSGEHSIPFYLVGGSWRALSRYAMHQKAWPLDDPHGFELAPEEALTLARTVGLGKLKSDVPGLSAGRLASLPDAAALLGVLVRELHPSRLIFSSWGLREGLLFRKLDKASQAQDPMLAGVAAFAEALGCRASTAAMVAGWTAEANPADGFGREHLRLAATMLALASAPAEPNLRADLATDWALRKRWVGIDAEGRAMLAAAGVANTGRTAMPPVLAQLAPQTALNEAVAWGLAIRLCRRFSGGSPQSLSASKLSRDEGRLVLAIQQPMHALCNETVEKDLRLLAEWLGLTPGVELVATGARLA